MKKIIFTILALSSIMTVTQAKENKMTKMFQSVPMNKVTIVQKGDAKAFCPNCGMTLSKFFKTNHSAVANGKPEQYCSIHCLAEASNKEGSYEQFKVVDVASLKFIDVSKATYVVGSTKKGTMTGVSKYAFKSTSSAKRFVKANGGKLLNFEQTLEVAKNDFNSDNQILSKRKAKMVQMGKTIYANGCKKTEKGFSSTAEAKAFIIKNNLCKQLNGKQLQAVGLYLKSK
jgi:nitrous oxide reductase accessory protein NosL